MTKIQFRLAARTDAAGKYNATAPLEGNEDNMFLDADLSNQAQGEFMADEVVNLSDKGCLMVVADGMGGMNAGEVASAIAIKTVMEYFDFEHMKGKTFHDSRSRMSYMEDVVVAADAAIKADSRTDKDHEGMGSTIIMAWLCDNEICLTWCGDSRAYLYRPGRGFWQVSKDHSYVQGLVDEGKITPAEAFDHPYGNIITRSLGDPEKKAQPESVNFDVYQGDIFMLCSDGLSGVLRDHKTYVEGQRIDTENLEDIITSNRASMAQCRDELFEAAQRNEWYDNVTAILCEIVSGDPLPAHMKVYEQNASHPNMVAPQAPNPVQNNLRVSRISIRKKSLPLIIAIVVLLIGGAGFLVWWFMRDKKPNTDKEFYAYCEEKGKVEFYREYVNRYPNGDFIVFAKDWIKQYEIDSISKQEQEKEQGKENVKESGKESVPETKGGNKNVKETTENNPNKPALPTNFEDLGEIIVGQLDNTGDLNKVGGDLNKVGGGKDNNQELNPVGGGSTQGTTTAPPRDEVDAYQRATSHMATLEDCLYWMENFGMEETRELEYHGHWTHVLQMFTSLYNKKLNSCKSIKDYENFLKEHDATMRKARLKDSDPDKRWKSRAQRRMEELKRPQPGAKNAPSNNPTNSKPKVVTVQKKK